MGLSFTVELLRCWRLKGIDGKFRESCQKYNSSFFQLRYVMSIFTMSCLAVTFVCGEKGAGIRRGHSFCGENKIKHSLMLNNKSTIKTMD